MNKVKKYRYKIVLSAPIGDRKGFLNVEVVNDKLEGTLSVMKNDNYFCGEVRGDGSCEIEGHIITLSGILDYMGRGHIDENSVALMLTTGKRKMLISGEALNKGGSKL